jgi:hypothetical protein
VHAPKGQRRPRLLLLARQVIRVLCQWQTRRQVRLAYRTQFAGSASGCLAYAPSASASFGGQLSGSSRSRRRAMRSGRPNEICNRRGWRANGRPDDGQS